MLYKHVKTIGLALAILGIASTLACAQDGRDVPVSRGVVAVITIIDAKTGMATLKTEEGEGLKLPKGWRWKVGDKVLCDRRDELPSRLRFQHCQPWK